MTEIKPPDGKCLFVYLHNVQDGFMIYIEARDYLEQLLSDAGASVAGEFASLSKAGIDYEPPPPEVGVVLHFAEMRIVDDGEGDYPGTREVVVQLQNMRAATKEESKAQIDGEYPWPAFFCRTCGEDLHEGHETCARPHRPTWVEELDPT